MLRRISSSGIVGGDDRQRRLEAQHVRTVGLAPRRRRKHRRAGRERDDREALERARRVAEELDVDAVGPARMLVEREHDRVAVLQQLEHAVERAALADRAEARAAHPPVDERIEPRRLDRAADEVDAVAHFGKLREPRHGAHLEVAEVAGEHEHALARVPRLRELVDAFDAHQRTLALAPNTSDSAGTRRRATPRCA